MTQEIAIYGITFEGKTVYVGQTKSTALRRFSGHKGNAKRGKSYCPKLYNHMRKYSLYKYSVNLLEKCAPEQSEEREKYWIAHFDTHANGLNCHPGGNQTRGESHYAHGDSNATRAAVEASVKARTGKTLSEETRKRMSASQTGKKRPQNYISIICNQTGTEYESIDAAASDLNLHLSGVSGFLKGKSMSVEGYTFRYANPELEATRRQKLFRKENDIAPDVRKSMSGKAKARIENLKKTPDLYEAHMSTLREGANVNNREVNARAIVSSDGKAFDAISDAAKIFDKEFERARSDIRRALKRGIKAFGVYWRYADADFISLKPRYASAKGTQRRVKPVVCLTTGKEWPTVKACAAEYNVPYVTMQKWLAKNLKPVVPKYCHINVAFKER